MEEIYSYFPTIVYIYSIADIKERFISLIQLILPVKLTIYGYTVIPVHKSSVNRLFMLKMKIIKHATYLRTYHITKDPGSLECIDRVKWLTNSFIWGIW